METRTITVAKDIKIDYIQSDDFTGLRINNQNVNTNSIINLIEQGFELELFDREKVKETLVLVLHHIIKGDKDYYRY